MSTMENGLIVRCLKCGQKNRISRDHLGDKPLCGRCGACLDEIFIQCLRCHRVNRIPEGRLYDLPLCGNCGSPLYDDYVRDVSDETFERDVLGRDETILICCWTPDCIFCRQAMPTLKKLAPKYLGNLKLLRLNITENPSLTSRYGVTRTPTYLLFKKGVLVDTIVGISTLDELERNLRVLSQR